MDIDFEELAIFVETLENTDFTHFLYEKGDLRIEVRRASATEIPSPTPTAVVPRPAAASPASPDSPGSPPSPSPESSLSPSDPPASAPLAPVATEGDVVVTAPLLGTVYMAPKPGEAPFVEIGSTVLAESSLCIVEVMKLMNTVHAGTGGVISAIHVRDGELVEHGQALFSIRPDAAV
ncbi:biotin/lipoyl-containing protein [Diaminobutyricimonas sp. TR449]|uniref:acetyl-CoA carboxylase biotin carboxyl carrier protein n=1 Tax=Diaminobutyricimonas sp. TR449 TaxID=2708076 RepID=UPI0014241E4B|nr:biotin/lipoyl-containing protein [Diaminobutyricimonas sp. TR449]